MIPFLSLKIDPLIVLNKELQNVSEQDIKVLIENRVLEGRDIEYKEELPGNSDGNKKEFLADVSSFANTHGGDLIFGIKEEGGVPTEIVGLKVGDLDMEIGRLENILSSGLKPKIQQLILPIKMSDGKVLILIRVKQSWIGPHRVVFGGHDKFYGRNANGKFPLDVEELRTAFNLSDTILTRIKDFYASRIIDIEADKTPLPLTGKNKVILHLIPFESFSTKTNIEIGKILEYHKKDCVRPMLTRGYGWSFAPQVNLLGVISYAGPNSDRDKARSYTQVFRNGVIEAVESSILEREGSQTIPSLLLENEILEYTGKYLSALRSFNFNPPIFIFITLTNIDGLIMAYDSFGTSFNSHPIKEKMIYLPEITIENYDEKLIKKLKPAFDLIWNACGIPESLNLDKDGNFIKQ